MENVIKEDAGKNNQKEKGSGRGWKNMKQMVYRSCGRCEYYSCGFCMKRGNKWNGQFRYKTSGCLEERKENNGTDKRTSNH